MNSSPRQGVKLFLETSNKKGKLKAQIWFLLAPRINAGRLAHASIAVKLLASKAKNETKLLKKLSKSILWGKG